MLNLTADEIAERDSKANQRFMVELDCIGDQESPEQFAARHCCEALKIDDDTLEIPRYEFQGTFSCLAGLIFEYWNYDPEDACDQLSKLDYIE